MNYRRFLKLLAALAISGSSLVWAQRTVSVVVPNDSITGSGTAAINLLCQGDENAIGFSVTFNSAVLRYDGYTAGTGATGATINPNPLFASTGKVGFAMALSSGVAFSAGSKQLVVLNFTALAPAATETIAFGNSPIPREIADSLANELVATYNNRTISVALPPAIASFTTQPTALAVTSGQNATFTSAGTGNPVPTVQWQKSSDGLANWTDLANAGRISGVTTNTLLITGALSTDAVSYRIVATNSQGTTNSNAALLTVNKAAQTITFAPLGAVAFGSAPFTLQATASSTLPVTYTSSNLAVATVSGSTVTVLAAGSTTITSSQSGNSEFNAATSVPQTLTVGLATQTTAFGLLPSKTFGDGPFNLVATATSSLAVSYTSSNPAVATVSGISVTIMGAGTTTISAIQGGNSNFAAASTVTQDLVVNKKAQVINFAALVQKTASDASFPLTGTTDSGLVVTYASSNTAVATVLGSTVSIIGVGTTNITASQIGNTNYLAAAPVVRPFDVVTAIQTITFPPIPAQTYVASPSPTVTLSATTTGTGLAVTYASSNLAVATVNGNVLTIVGAGSTDITASQAGNANFGPATPKVNTLTVNKATATISFSSNLAPVYSGVAKSVTATTLPVGLAVSFTYNGTGTAPINAGTYPVVATVNDLNYAGTQNGSLVIAKASQTITFAALASKTFGDAAFPLTASSDSDLPVSFTSLTPAVATVTTANNVSTVAILTGGTTTVRATQLGDGNYNAAAPVDRDLIVAKAAASVVLDSLNQTFNTTPRLATATTSPAGLTVNFTYNGTGTAPTNAGTYPVVATIADPRYAGSASGTLTIAKADQTITFADLPSKPLDSGSFNLGATATSGLAISYAASSPSVGTVATIAGNAVSLVNVGTLTITASQAGDTNYNAASPAAKVLTVLNQSQDVVFDAGQVPAKTFGAAPFPVSATSNRSLLVSFLSSNLAVATVAASSLSGNTSTATVTIVGGGTATITARQVGDANTAAANDVVRTLTVAKKDQAITFATLPGKIFNDAAFPVSATSDSGLAPVISVVSGPATIAAGTVTITGAGDVTLRAAQLGNANFNAAANVDRTFTVAKASQTITFSALTSPVLINAGPLTLTASAAPSGLPVTFTSSNGGVASVANSVVTLVGLGSTTFTAEQTGSANYLAAPNQTRTLTVNALAPVITATPPLGQTAVEKSSFVFGPITVNPLSASSSRVFSMSPVAGLSVNPSTGIISGTPTTAGSYTIVLTVTNETAPADSRTINLVVQPPAPVITSGAAVAVVAGTPISYTVATKPVSGPVLAVTGLPGWLLFNAATGVFSGTPTVPATHTVQVTATNATGSAVLPLLISVTPNPSAPVYNGTKTPSGTAGVAFSFFNDFGSGSGTAYALTSGTLPTGLALNSATGEITGTTQQTGSFPVSVTATRSSLSATATVTISINPAANAPVVTVTGGNVRAGTVGTLFGPIAFTASPVATSFSIPATGSLPAWLSVGGTSTAPTLSGTPTTAGTTTISILASNTAGAGQASTLIITVAPNPLAPAITSSPSVQGRVGVPLTYTLAAKAGSSVVAPPALTYGMVGTLPLDLVFNGAAGTVTGTPAAGTTGQATVYFGGTSATPGVGSGLALAVTFNIAPPLTVPVVQSNGSAQAQVGQSFSYTIEASNNPTSFGATPLPPGLSLNSTTGVISGVPSAVTALGVPASIGLTATNADGASNRKELALTIAPAPATPLITSAASATGRVGVALTYQITATETPTSFVAIDLPPGLSANPVSGAISGTPTGSGPFTASLAAANASGLGASAPLNFAIAPALTAPAITSAATALGQVGTAFSYQIVATPGPITSYAVTGNLPLGVIFNSATGSLSGSPTSPGPFSLSLTATSAGGTSLPQALSLQIKPADNVPVVTSPGSATANVGVDFTYTIEATNLPTSRDAVNLPAGLAVNPFTGVISGSPTAVGSTVASLVAANANGTGPTRDLTINVQPSLSAPVITSANRASAQVGTTFSYQISGTNAPTSYELIGAPAWLTSNSGTGLIAGTPTEPLSLVVLLLASNNAGRSAPSMLTVTIAAAPNTPVVSSSQSAQGTVGVVFASYTISSLPALATTYLAVGLPPGLTLNGGTGVIAGTPTASGNFPVKISGTNVNGVGYATTVTIQIAPSITFGL